MFHEPSLVLLALRHYTEIIDLPNFMINCKSLLIALNPQNVLSTFVLLQILLFTVGKKNYVVINIHVW
jgi:hypothetical protein